jgi:probable rRNA maturation factor
MRLKVFKEIPIRLPAHRSARLFELVTAREGRKRWAATVNLVLTGDRAIARLNRQYRSAQGPTDVLSFNIDSPDSADAVFGEIYMSVPYLRRQARQYRRGLWDEFLLLFCHGLLHLFGHDHAKKGDEKKMFARQEYYLKRLRDEG